MIIAKCDINLITVYVEGKLNSMADCFTDRKSSTSVSLSFASSRFKAYDYMSRIFVAFCIFASISMSSVNPLNMLCFSESLNFNGKYHAVIAN